MKLRLFWTDPASQRYRQPILDAPIALGQTFEAMPKEISGKSVSRMVVSDRQADEFQAVIVEVEGQVYLIDNGGKTYVNQHPVEGQAQLNSGDRIRIGQTELQFQILEAAQQPAAEQPLDQPPQPSQTRQPAQRQQPIQQQQPVQRQQPVPAPKTKPHQAASSGHRSSHNLTAEPPNNPSYPASQMQAPAAMPVPRTPAAEGQPGSGSGCRRIVGFLFKRPCGRSSNTGCNYCANGNYSSQAFSADYRLYEGFGRYELGDWGYGLLANQSNAETE